jgi:hypothetical protein
MNDGTEKYVMMVPEFRIMAHLPCYPVPSDTTLQSKLSYSILRWELGTVFYNTNTMMRPIRQKVANMPNGVLHSQTLVEVNLECPRFSFFTSVPLPSVAF